MGDNKISATVVRLACDAYDKVAQWGDVTNEFEAMNAALHAALPHLQGGAVPVAGLPWASYWLSQGRPDVSHDHEAYELAYEWAMQFHPQPAELSEQHPDDLAVDTFANAMKSKMTVSRWRGRSGWDDLSQCSQSQLSAMLRAHVEKGDPVDVANFCMMLSLRGEGIESAAGLSEVSGGSGEVGVPKGWRVTPHTDPWRSGDRWEVYGPNGGGGVNEHDIQCHSVRGLLDALAATGKQQVGEVQGSGNG